MRMIIVTAAASLTIAVSTTAQAFCGFYVPRADTSLFNRASQIVLIRDAERTVITMANDFQGGVEDFALEIPVPTFIERGQINVAEHALIEHLDAYTAPRLVEYDDPDPCARYEVDRNMAAASTDLPASAAESSGAGRSQGVTIEARYTVGEYDILILSAEESNGLIRWLDDNGYRVPRDAHSIVDSYLGTAHAVFCGKSQSHRTVATRILLSPAIADRL